MLKIKSGDTVEVQTLLTDSPEGAGTGVSAARGGGAGAAGHLQGSEGQGAGRAHSDGADLRRRRRAGRYARSPHQKIKLAIPYGYNGFVPKRGFLPEDFDGSRTKIIRLDEKRMVGHFAKGIEIPLRPFFGSMGVAPPPSAGRVSSGPPGVHAGNLDNKELVAGTTLFIPVHAAGALFAVGDGHAAQGNGEVVSPPSKPRCTARSSSSSAKT